MSSTKLTLELLNGPLDGHIISLESESGRPASFLKKGAGGWRAIPLATAPIA
jgi:hypothetical protein